VGALLLEIIQPLDQTKKLEAVQNKTPHENWKITDNSFKENLKDNNSSNDNFISLSLSLSLSLSRIGTEFQSGENDV